MRVGISETLSLAFKPTDEVTALIAVFSGPQTVAYLLERSGKDLALKIVRKRPFVKSGLGPARTCACAFH